MRLTYDDEIMQALEKLGTDFPRLNWKRGRLLYWTTLQWLCCQKRIR